MEHKDWPALPLAEWEPTYLTLHRFVQIVGKVGLSHAPWMNHWWHVPLVVTARGLTMSVPCDGRELSITFDFCAHQLVAHTSDKRTETLDLAPMTVAAFYGEVMTMLEHLDVTPAIWPVPVEVTDTTPFPDDRHHAAYDRDRVEALHRILLAVDRVFRIHRGRFIGKASPVHFFWGAFDLAVTRFSGRPNPRPPPGKVMEQAYSHEVISHGFWPGGDWPGGARVEEPVFYAYAMPEPAGFSTAPVFPAEASYSGALGEFLLPYDFVRTAGDPESVLLAFMESTYRAAAERAGWDLATLSAHPAGGPSLGHPG
ncbi:MAG TPA: DUF5996 family protein [Kofleriaceae bacterium]|nr:DUF5996 family protein [Kofleriaceae bacterium]